MSEGRVVDLEGFREERRRRLRLLAQGVVALIFESMDFEGGLCSGDPLAVRIRVDGDRVRRRFDAASVVLDASDLLPDPVDRAEIARRVLAAPDGALGDLTSER